MELKKILFVSREDGSPRMENREYCRFIRALRSAMRQAKRWENCLIWKQKDIFIPDCRIRQNDYVAAKITALEGGKAGMLTSSGQAANFFALFNICEAGSHIVASSSIYGGTYNLISVTMKKMGVDVTFVDPDCTEEELNAAVSGEHKGGIWRVHCQSGSDGT